MKSASNPIFLRTLPKVDLHRHLDLSLRFSTLVHLAQDLDLQHSDNLHDLQNEFLILEPMKDLNSVLKKFQIAQQILGAQNILKRIAYEAVEDAFNDGVRILELRYAPEFIKQVNPHLSYDQIHAEIMSGVNKAEAIFPIAVGVIGIIQRTQSPESATQVVDMMVNQRDNFIGIDLADSEDNFEPEKFARHFSRARAAGLRVTVHSGESPSEHAAVRIEKSIDILGAERIGHGVQAVHHMNCISLLRDRKILLEVCPWSNYLTKVTGAYENHPIRNLLNAGVLIGICTDDPGVFGNTLTDEYVLLNKYHQLSEKDFRFCNQQAAQASFIRKEKRDRVMNLF